MTLHLRFILFICVINVHSFAQNLDSLKKTLLITKSDTSLCKILNLIIDAETDETQILSYNQKLEKICDKNLLNKSLDKKTRNLFLNYYAFVLNNHGIRNENHGEIDKALKYYNQSLLVRKELNDKNGIATALNNIGLVYCNQGFVKQGLEYYEKSLKLAQELNDKESIASSLNNMGLAYSALGDVTKVLEYYHKSLRIREEINNQEGIAISLNNIALVFVSQDDIAKALEYYQKSLKISEKINNKKLIATTLNNIGYMYKGQGDFTKALEYYFKSFQIRKELNNKVLMATSLNNIGIVFKNQKEYSKAYEYYLKSLKLSEEVNDREGMSNSLSSISNLLLVQEKYKEAQHFGERSLKIAQEIGYPSSIKSASGKLSKIYAKTGNYKGAYDMQILLKQMSDSINNENTRKETIKSQFKYEYDKKTAADSVRFFEEKKIVALQLKQEKTQRFALFGGLILVVIFAGFMFNRFKITQKQKNIIEIKEKETQKQKIIVEEKQKEIIDSITYAKRIQEAILPPTTYWENNLPNSFIYYKPKDIVAGDFYWMEKQGDLLFFAAADCTGHGVPGALVSVVCSNALNRSLLEFKMTETGKLLDKTRELVISTFEKSDKDVKDGMDISLCCLNTKTNQLHWSGANNSLWLIQNISENETTEIISLKADKQPVGKFSNEKPFTTHSIQLNPNDNFYIFTDGFPDQFGGPKGKKFKYKQLEELLLSISHESMETQKQKLEEVFEKWKGDLEQVDDVCIIGVRI